MLAGLDAATTPAEYSDFLQVSEINYNPSNPTAAEVAAGVTDNDAFEFIELYNSSNSISLDLNSVRFTTGITFNFTGSSVTSLGPGDYALVVKDQNAFEVRYGAGQNGIIAGVYVGSLKNSGENLVLINPSGGEIQNFTYNDSHPWPVAADGYGFTLNLIDPDSDPKHSKGENWTSNGPANGSPGAANVPTGPEIVINEILSHTDPPQVDQIELFNPTGSSVNVAGWFLSDDVAVPQKFRIPAGSVIPANGYLVLFEDNDGDDATPPPSDYFGSAFSLSSLGEDLYLQAGDGTNLTGYGNSVRFRAQFNSEANGRFPNRSSPAPTSPEP
ncbi:MAG: lamin tail domain-containing protein, partial [Pirellulales bacterium]